MSKWRIIPLKQVIDINPSETIARKAIAKKIAMERLQPFTKFIYGFENAEFRGGSKFRNGDTLVARINAMLGKWEDGKSDNT